jgi:hypothetical protein
MAVGQPFVLQRNPSWAGWRGRGRLRISLMSLRCEWVWWITPIILATQEAETRRIMVPGQPWQIIHETLSRKYPTLNRAVAWLNHGHSTSLIVMAVCLWLTPVNLRRQRSGGSRFEASLGK